MEHTMRIGLLLTTGVLLAAVTLVADANAGSRPDAAFISGEQAQLQDVSAQKRKARPRAYTSRPRARAYQSYGRTGGNQIACTAWGCRPIPRSCQIRTEYNWNWDPTGFDAVVCP
jgi:hypothetical protein